MSAFLRASSILFLAHLRRTFVSRRALLSAGLAALPVAASLLVAKISAHEGPPPLIALLHMGWFLQLQTIVPLVALVMGSAVVAEEIEDRTVTYLFTRPIPRASVLFGRWLAALVLVLVLLSSACALVLWILSDVGNAEHRAELPAGFRERLFWLVLAGGAVYSALFAAAGALFRRPVLVGLGYTFVVEGFLANLPGGNQKLTIQYYLKSLLIRADPELLDSFSESLALVKLAEPAAAARTLLAILLVSLALGAWSISRREYVLAS